MTKTTNILLAAVAAIALLGVGLFVGSKVGAETQVISADADKPYTERDALVVGTFGEATHEFERLVGKASKGKNVSKEITQQALLVRRIAESAEGEDFKQVVSATADAMILLAVAITGDDGKTAQEGLEKYQDAQAQISELVDAIQGESDPGAGDAPAEQPAE